MSLQLYSYWRSSAAYRVRIALNLKGIAFSTRPINIKPGEDEQTGVEYARLNPQMRVPSLELPNGTVIGQSMAIIEWLEETYPQPALLPKDLTVRASCRAFADTIACDIHPLNNLSVLRDLRSRFDADKSQVDDWYRHWVRVGFEALETLAGASADPFLFGDVPSLAEVCLIPQVYHARRLETDLSAFPRLVEIEAKCLEMKAFKAAVPEIQPDAPA